MEKVLKELHKHSLVKLGLIIAAVIVVGAGVWFAVYSLVNNHSQDQSQTQALDGLKDAGINPANNKDLALTSPRDTAGAGGTSEDQSVSDGSSSLGIKLLDDIHQLADGEMISIPSGSSSRLVSLEIATRGYSLKKCTVTHTLIKDDTTFTKEVENLQPLTSQKVALFDGDHSFTVECGSLHAGIAMRAADRQPKACKDFSFNESPVSANSAQELSAGMVGKWSGCVTTPWVPKYHVDITFNANGTYSAVSGEKIDGTVMNAMYYGMEKDSMNKKYYLDGISGDKKGQGGIDIVFDVGTVNHDELRNVQLMGDKLSFEFMHRGQYGPLKFELYRQ